MRGQKETPDSFPFRFLLKAFFALRLIGGTHEFVAAFGVMTFLTSGKFGKKGWLIGMGR